MVRSEGRAGSFVTQLITNYRDSGPSVNTHSSITVMLCRDDCNENNNFKLFGGKKFTTPDVYQMAFNVNEMLSNLWFVRYHAF